MEGETYYSEPLRAPFICRHITVLIYIFVKQLRVSIHESLCTDGDHILGFCNFRSPFFTQARRRIELD